ncbi:MAG: thioredoxin domain-containing protein [Gemmatimonadota bacterium]
MKRFRLVFGVVAVFAVAIVGYSIATNASSGAVTGPVELEGIDDPARLIELAQGVEMGDPGAPLTMIEFADFQCPSCAGFALQVKPMVNMSYIEDGSVRFVYYDFPLSQHGNSFLASRSARCAQDQDLFWEYHDALYRDQPRWAAAANPVSIFVEHARALGADADTFRSCVNSDRHAEVVTANMRLGEQLGVSGTPSIMLSQGGGMATRIRSYDFETIRETVENALP